MKQKLPRQLVCGIFIIAFSAVLYFVNKVERQELMNNSGRTFQKAVVEKVLEDQNNKVQLKITTGKYKNQSVQASAVAGYLYGAECRPGLKVIAIVNESGKNLSVSVYNYDRGIKLYLILAFFFAILWLVGGKKGLNSAIGLVFTFVCIIWIFLPLIYRGVSPVFAAVIVVALTTVVVMYLLDGFSKKSLCAIAGTIFGVITSAVFALLFGKFTHISGYNVSDIENLVYIGQMTDVKIGELMFAGILISTLGAVMDVAMSLASTVNELHEKSPALNAKDLFKSAMAVGRDMTGTMSNTLILAFAGGSINTLVFIYCYKYDYLQIIDMYSTGLEIIQGISATLGVVLAVPFVSLITSRVFCAKKVLNK